MKIYRIYRRRTTRWLSWLTVILMLLALIVLTSCQDVNSFLKSILPSGQTTATGKTDPVTTSDKPGQAVRHEFKQEGIRFEITLDQGNYRSGDVIKVKVKITNTTDQAIPWQAGSTSFGPAGSVGIRILLGGSKDQYLIEAGEPRIGDTAMLYGELKPGASIETGAEFTTRYRVDADIIKEAWSGEHLVSVVFARGQNERVNPITVTAPVQITGETVGVISRDKAITLAKEIPAYADWLKQHSGAAIVKKENNNYYVNFTGTWEKVTEELYQQMLNDKAEPEGGASFADNKWTVRFMLKAGDAPHTLIVEIDGKTGKILGSRTE